MLLLIFALARPFALGGMLSGTPYAVIIDVSASMNATDVKSSRLERAKQGAADYLARTLRGGDKAVIVTAGATPFLISPLTK